MDESGVFGFVSESFRCCGTAGQLLPMTRGKTLIPYLSARLLSKKGCDVAKITFNWLKVHIKISLSRLIMETIGQRLVQSSLMNSQIHFCLIYAKNK